MAELREINRAVKQSLDLFFDGGAEETAAYSQPIQSPEDLLNRGLITPEGEATDKGELFSHLQGTGIFAPDGKLSEKGAVYAMPYEETLKRENRKAFEIRFTDGVDAPEAGFGDMVAGVRDTLWDAGAGLARHVGLMAQGFNPFADDHSVERGASATAIIDGTIQATQQLVGMGEVGAGLLGIPIGRMIDMDKAAEGVLWNARQDLARTRYTHQQAKVGETLENLTSVTAGIEMAETARAQLPPEEYAKLVKQGNAFGQFIDPTILLPAGAAAKAGKVSLITRAGIKADTVLAKTAALDLGLAERGVQLAATQRAAAAAGNASELAARLAEELGARFEATGDQLLAKRATLASEIGARTAQEATQHADELARLTAEADQLATLRNSYATRIPEEVATRTQQAIELGRKAYGVPIAAVGSVGEAVGKFLIDTNTQLSAHAKLHGYEGALNILKYGVAPIAGMSVGGLPGAAAALGVLASGPIIEATSKFGRIVGQELMKARGQVPFWQRVANYSELSAPHRFLSHMIDTATMGGAVSGAVRGVSRGAVAAYPLNLMFEVLSDGGTPNADTFKRAAAQSLVIGGSSAMLGGMFRGTKARHRELAAGDELNFRRDMTDPEQRGLYDGMSQGARRSIATYAASNPQLGFRFTDSGASSHSDNVATINARATDPLKALLAHEVMHHVVIRNQNEAGVIALLIGDGEAGGLLRSNDGTLDPSFQQFHEAYNARMQREGRQPVSERQAALEYYVDSAADHVSQIAESGELGAIAGRTNARRVIAKVVEGTLSRLPIIRDLHFKMGGLLDGEGRMVMGSGLLADGIRELPQARAMTREMLRTAAGRSQGLFEATGRGRGKDDEGGATFPVQKGDKPVIDKLISLFETEEKNGRTVVKYDSNGDPIPISAATDMARSNLSVVIGEAMQKRAEAGLAPKPGEIHFGEGRKFEGNYLGEDVLRIIKERGILNPEQLRILRNINDAAKNYDGHRFSVINHPATKKVGKKVRYATLAPTLRDVVPVAIIPTKSGNLTVGLLSVTQLHANIETRLSSKRGQRLYQGNREKLFNDVKNVMELHRADKNTDAHFQEEYGATRAAEYKNFVNTLFGLMSPSMKDVNPLFDADKIGYKENVYKTYRIDRISQATRMTGDTHLPLPFVYASAKINMMPNGLPTLDAAGLPVATPAATSPTPVKP